MTEPEVKIVSRVRDWLRSDGWRTWQEIPTGGARGRSRRRT